MHGAKNFPFRKESSDLDIELPDACGDDDYLAQLQTGLQQLAQHCEPDLIFYLAGADPHEGDRLGRLKLSFAGLQMRDRMVLQWAGERRMPMAMAMAGGYGKEIADTVQVQINTFALAYEAWQHWQNQQP